MRTVALEEHFSVPSIASRIDKAVLARRGYRPRTLPKDAPNPLELLPEFGERRLKSMNDAGISVQVLSNSGPGPDLVAGPDGVAMARLIKAPKSAIRGYVQIAGIGVVSAVVALFVYAEAIYLHTGDHLRRPPFMMALVISDGPGPP